MKGLMLILLKEIPKLGQICMTLLSDAVSYGSIELSLPLVFKKWGANLVGFGHLLRMMGNLDRSTK